MVNKKLDIATMEFCLDLAFAALAAEHKRCSVLTDDMLHYSMAALGTGSPQEAERFRAFWMHAVTARDTPREGQDDRARPAITRAAAKKGVL